MAFAYPDFAKDILQKGKMDTKKICTSCSACTQMMINGDVTGCAVRDNKVYGPVLRSKKVTK